MQLDDAHNILPSCNTHQKWVIDANKARRFHDYATAVLVAGGNLIGLGAVLKIYPLRVADGSIALWISIVIAIVFVLATLLSV